MTDTVKPTYEQIFASVQALTDLLSCDIPMKQAGRIVAVANQVNRATEDFRTIQKNLMEQYAVKDDEGNPVLDKDNNPTYTPEYETKMQELFTTESPYEIAPIHTKDLGEKGIVKPATLFILSQSQLVVID